MENHPDETTQTVCNSSNCLSMAEPRHKPAIDRLKGLIDQPALEVAAQTMAENQVASPARSLIGQSVGHFRILSLLGKGGMGEVWLAEDTHLSRKVAIKLLPAEFTTDAACLRRFAQEARTASALNHPNIITIYEIGEVQTEAGATHYIVTEYVAGKTLREQMTGTLQQGVKLADAIDIAAQIGDALAAAHEAGITHRDIKPENVMVRRDGIVKVLDFGLAKLTEAAPPIGDSQLPALARHSTDVGMMMGTPRYMSPEQARGQKVDARTDTFSLGVMLYEMITGRAPFVGATTNETIAAILRDAPLPLTHHALAVPVELERIVSQALCKERADRYQTARALLSDLKELKQRIEFQAKTGEMRSISPPSGGTPGSQNLPPQGVTTSVAHKSFGLFTPALRAIATWVSRSRQPVLTEKDLILLADFENTTGDAVFDGTLKQGLAIQLRQSPFLSLFPEERVRQTLRLMKRSPEERVTARIAREICIRHDLKALIAGSIAPLGSHYVITLEAIHGQNGETLENEQVEAKSKEQVLRALSQAATRLRAKLGESLSSLQHFHKEFLEETTTQKLAAFQAYSLGYEQSLNGRFTDAIQLYRRAVELDPDFAYAWSMLSIHHSIVGWPGLAAEYAEKAYALKDLVSDYEQLQITFRYHFNFTGDMNKAIDAAILFMRTYPRTSTAPIDLLVAYDLIGQHDQAVAQGREAVRLNPNFAPAYWYLGRALLHLNRFAEAKGIFKQALEQKFNLINIHSTLYLIAFTEGNTIGMQQQLEWANGRPEEYVALDWQAGAAAYAGQWRKAQEFSRRAIDLAGRGDTKELAARYATEQSLRGVVLEDCQRAKVDAAQGLKIAGGRDSLPRAALALALCGEAQQVKLLIDELSKRFPEDTVINSIWLPTIRAAIDLQRGDAAQAIEQLRTTTRYEAAAEFWPQYLRGHAYLKLGRGAESTTEFQKILDHRGYAPLSPLSPLAQLGLARGAALTGDAVRSRKAYEAFFATWPQADSDLPMLTEAKREYGMNR
jgi:serine/threonine protein kinase/Tfp pilus assembly protein PilF